MVIISTPRSLFFLYHGERNAASSMQFGHHVPVTGIMSTLLRYFSSFSETMFPSMSGKENRCNGFLDLSSDFLYASGNAASSFLMPLKVCLIRDPSCSPAIEPLLPTVPV